MQDIIMISDPLSDVDDIFSFVVASAMEANHFFNLKTVVATIGDEDIRVKRAKFAKGCFDYLGHKDLVVCVGCQYCESSQEHNYSFGSIPATQALNAEEKDIEFNAFKVLRSVIKSAKKSSLSIIVNAQMFDVYYFLSKIDEQDLAKIDKIVIMGGVEAIGDGYILPDIKSYNHAVCFEAAQNLCNFAFEKNIKLVFVPKETVYEVQVEKSFYEEIEACDNLISRCIVESNKAFFNRLWLEVQNNKYSHFDVKRFSRVFCGDEEILYGTENFEQLWSKVKYFNLYDAIAVMAASEDLYEQFGYYEKISLDKEVYIARVKDKTALKEEMTKLVMTRIKN